jgi:hypothetical protein
VDGRGNRWHVHPSIDVAGPIFDIGEPDRAGAALSDAELMLLERLRLLGQPRHSIFGRNGVLERLERSP